MSHTFDGCFFRVSDFFFFLAMISARANSFRNERSNHEKNVFPCDHTHTNTHNLFWNDADDFRYHHFGHSIVFCILANDMYNVRCTLDSSTNDWFTTDFLSSADDLKCFDRETERKKGRAQNKNIFLKNESIEYSCLCFRVWNKYCELIGVLESNHVPFIRLDWT